MKKVYEVEMREEVNTKFLVTARGPKEAMQKAYEGQYDDFSRAENGAIMQEVLERDFPTVAVFVKGGKKRGKPNLGR